MSKPKITIKFSDEYLKVLRITGKQNDKLSDHKVSIPAILYCKQGKVVYNQSSIKQVIEQDNFKLIPSEEIHNIEFEIESTLDLILFSNAKLNFTNL